MPNLRTQAYHERLLRLEKAAGSEFLPLPIASESFHPPTSAAEPPPPLSPEPPPPSFAPQSPTLAPESPPYFSSPGPGGSSLLPSDADQLLLFVDQLRSPEFAPEDLLSLTVNNDGGVEFDPFEDPQPILEHSSGESCGDSDESEPPPSVTAEEENSPLISHLLREKTPLLPGCAVTVLDAICTLFIFYLTSHLALIQFQAMLDIFHLFMPGRGIPRKADTFLKIFGDSAGKLVIHEYCDSCYHKYKEGETMIDCPGCHAARYLNNETKRMKAFFVELPIHDDLTHLFGENEFIAGLEKHKKRVSLPGVISDVQDGEAYKVLKSRVRLGPWDLVFGFNTDGVSPYNSSKYQLWPIYWQVLDLPPELRFESRYTRLCGLWFGPQKPNFDLFFTPFHQEMDTFSKKGFPFVIRGKPVTAKGYMLFGNADTPAKADLLHMHHHNGKNGCPHCLNPGMNVSTEKTKVKSTVHVYETINYPLRSNEGILGAAAEALRMQTPVQGIKAPNVFSLLFLFDLVFGFPVDFMHAIALGVAKKLTDLFFDKAYAKFPWYLGGRIDEIDSLLANIKPPRGIKRLPRSLRERKYWKASEFKAFLLYFAPVVLEGFLPEDYFLHLLMLVAALHILLSRSITQEQLRKAGRFLMAFLLAFEKLYGLRFSTINFHLLSHLTDCVRLFGPLWAFSCFPYESMNGFMVRCLSGTNNSVLQMIKTVLCLQNIEKISRLIVDPGCREFVSHILDGDGPTRSEKTKFGENYAVGPLKEKEGRLTSQRAIVRGHLLESQSYTRNAKRNNYTVMSSQGLFMIESFVVKDGGLFAAGVTLAIKDYDLTPTVLSMEEGMRMELSCDEITSGPLCVLRRGDKLVYIDLPFSPDGN